MTLRAEWDIKSIIFIMTYKELDMEFAFMHVKSHQDNKTAIASLSLKLHLNVEADCLATEYTAKEHMCQPIVKLFPSAKNQGGIHDTKTATGHPI
jgi:hypothetical protein